MDDHTRYGSLKRYSGTEGEAYFERQQVSGRQAALYNRRVFTPYVGEAYDLLDFGCGGGYLLEALPARSKVGVEINPAARSAARAMGITAVRTIGDLDGKTFDRIITSHALEHIPSPHAALSQLRERLRPEGLLIWLSPIDDWRTARQRQWHPDDPDMHLYTWTPMLIGNLLVSAGFWPVKISVLRHAFPPSSLARVLWRTHPELFHTCALFWSIARKRRQIVAVASPAPENLDY